MIDVAGAVTEPAMIGDLGLDPPWIRRRVIAELNATYPTTHSPAGRADRKLREHPLGGEWKGWRDCHVEPDWVLISRKDDVTLQLGRTGSHSDLFE